MSIYQRGETYAHRIDVRNRLSVVTTPVTIKENIYDQCGHWLVKSLSMSSDAIGKFYYNYPITSTATYGRYYSKVTATDAGGNVSIFKDEFFVLPWDAVDDVRQVMGIPESKSVDDDTIANIFWSSYLYALKDLYDGHMGESPGYNPSTGAGFDGTNHYFRTTHYPIADVNGDGTVNNSCPSDIYVTWMNSTGSLAYGSVVVNNAEFGQIHIYQAGGTTAIPATSQGVYLYYWTKPARYDEYIFQQAVIRLTCYELSKRLQSLDQITLADIKNNNPIILLDPGLYMKEYKRYLQMSRGPVSGGVDLGLEEMT